MIPCRLHHAAGVAGAGEEATQHVHHWSQVWERDNGILKHENLQIELRLVHLTHIRCSIPTKIFTDY